MHIDEGLIPAGQMEGMACLELVVHQPVEPADLIARVLREQRPGVQALWIKTAPWGDPTWDHAVLHLLSDERLHELQVMALRDVESEVWAGVSLAWVGDATNMVARQVSTEQIRDAAVALPYRPRLDELVVVDPAESNLTPAVLDELFTLFDPQVAAWVYATDTVEYLEKVAALLPRCASPWGLRRRHENTI